MLLEVVTCDCCGRELFRREVTLDGERVGVDEARITGRLRGPVDGVSATSCVKAQCRSIVEANFVARRRNVEHALEERLMREKGSLGPEHLN